MDVLANLFSYFSTRKTKIENIVTKFYDNEGYLFAEIVRKIKNIILNITVFDFFRNYCFRMKTSDDRK